MIESSIAKVAILTLCEESSLQTNQKEPEQYVLSDKEATFVGRSNDCQFIISPRYSRVSRYHAKIELVKIDESEFVWQISDLETPNGTFVNNQRVINGQFLRSGDRITLGKPNGANLNFEYKQVDIEKLHEASKKKPRYDETVVSDEDNFENEENLTQLFSDNPVESSPEKYNSDNTSTRNLKTTEDVSDLKSDIKTDSNQSNFAKILAWASPKIIISLATFLIASLLLYQAQEIFKSRKNGGEELDAYINNMSKLLLDKELGSLDFNNSVAGKARESANAQTLAKLKSLDGQEKGMLLRFLHKSKLIKMQPQKLSEEWLLSSKLNVDKQKFQLLKQDFNRKELVYLRQFKADGVSSKSLPALLVKEADYVKNYAQSNNRCANSDELSNLQSLGCSWIVPLNVKSYAQIFITPIQLSGSDLTGIVLKDASLEGINLEGAYISFLKCKERSSGNFFEDNIRRKLFGWLSNNNCSADLSGTGFQGARFYKSVLIGANLSNTNLESADFRQADLRGANLSGASLQNANLAGACYIEENWRGNFPEKGSDGAPFNPATEKMKPVSIKNSDLTNPQQFQECKSLSAPNVETLK